MAKFISSHKGTMRMRHMRALVSCCNWWNSFLIHVVLVLFSFLLPRSDVESLNSLTTRLNKHKIQFLVRKKSFSLAGKHEFILWNIFSFLLHFKTCLLRSNEVKFTKCVPPSLKINKRRRIFFTFCCNSSKTHKTKRRLTVKLLPIVSRDILKFAWNFATKGKLKKILLNFSFFKHITSTLARFILRKMRIDLAFNFSSQKRGKKSRK